MSDPMNETGAPAEGQQDLNQVRELLVGPVTRDLQQRLSQMEQRLDRTVRELEKTVDARVAEMQKRIDDEMAKLEQRAENLTEEMSQARESVELELLQQGEQLRAELVDRETFSSLFSEMALRIGAPAHTGAMDTDKPDPELEKMLDSRIG